MDMKFRRVLQFILESAIILILAFFTYGWFLPPMYNASDDLIVASGLVGFAVSSVAFIYVFYWRINSFISYFNGENE